MRHLGPVDIAKFREALLKQPESLWSANINLQNVIAPDREVDIIYLQMCLGWPARDITHLAGWQSLQSVFEPIRAAVAAFFKPGGHVLNAQVARLGPGKSIAPHHDKAPVLAATHRVHVPITSNDAIVFHVDAENMQLLPGEAYELDNMRRHGVENQGQTSRIHLIIDYFDGPAAGA